MFRIITPFLLFASIGLSQNTRIVEIFSQKILREDFTEQNYAFPTLTGSNGEYAVIIDSLGYYAIGSGNQPHPVLLDWKNDLEEFELKVKLRLKHEDESFVIQKIQGDKGQIIGLILKYNRDTQEALIFEINGVKQYRLSHLKNGKLKNITQDWIFTDHLKRNETNEIAIKTKGNIYEFYINNEFTFSKNLNTIKNHFNSGDFGFYLGVKTQVIIDQFYISALKTYNGINKLFNLSEEDAKKIVEERNQIEAQLKKEKQVAIRELKEVIKLLEKELKGSNQLIDSLKEENDKFEPFQAIIEENGNFMYTLTKDLKEQMEKNNKLLNDNQVLMDSIDLLIRKQDDFKLEYLRVLDSMMEKNDTINEK